MMYIAWKLDGVSKVSMNSKRTGTEASRVLQDHER